MHRTAIIVALALTGLFASTATAAAARGTTHDVRVNGDIQAAINGASNGDTIQLAAGQYDITTTIDPGGKQVTILGTVDANGKPTSILDGGNPVGGTSGVLVLGCESGETTETVFRNLVIQNGYSLFVSGGMGLSNSSPTLINCMFKGNEGFEGGAIYNNNSSPTLSDCSFIRNVAVGEVVDTHQPAARSQSVSAYSHFPRGRSFIRRLNLPAAGNSQAKSPQNTVR